WRQVHTQLGGGGTQRLIRRQAIVEPFDHLEPGMIKCSGRRAGAFGRIEQAIEGKAPSALAPGWRDVFQATTAFRLRWPKVDSRRRLGCWNNGGRGLGLFGLEPVGIAQLEQQSRFRWF